MLSGPSFAIEVAQQLPTAVLAASNDPRAIEMVQEEFRSTYFRLYGSADVVGVELVGALKNIIAIAAGVVEGLGLGHNALAALITRGLAEISRLAAAEGGRRETPSGLSGLGDLVLTCTGSLSRNRHVGIELARGRQLSEILASMKMIAEGREDDIGRARAWCASRRRTANRDPNGSGAGGSVRCAHGRGGVDAAPAASRGRVTSCLNVRSGNRVIE